MRTIMPTAVNRSPHHAAIILFVNSTGSAVALIKVTKHESATASQKKIMCTVSLPLGANIKIDVMMKEKTIIIYSINKGESAIIKFLSLSWLPV